VGNAVWVMVVLAAVLVLVALVAFVLPLARSRSAGTALSVDGVRATRPASPSGSLARGFGYLYLSPGPQTRRGGVHERLARAFARIDAVDPHAAPRRIGEALAQAGIGEPPPRAATEPPPDLGWRSRDDGQPRDLR